MISLNVRHTLTALLHMQMPLVYNEKKRLCTAEEAIGLRVAVYLLHGLLSLCVGCSDDGDVVRLQGGLWKLL